MKVICRNNEVLEGSFEDRWVKEAFWHTSAHVLAQAVKRLYPDAKCAMDSCGGEDSGSAAVQGFYWRRIYGNFHARHA